MQQNFSHVSVLLESTIDYLLSDPAGIYVDCTLGGGGHSLALCEKLNKNALLIGIDQDEDALVAAQERLADVRCKTIFKQGNFSNLTEILDECNIAKVQGIVFDLGVSSYQLDTAERGFSYMHDGPLDMRMNKTAELSAELVVNEYSEARLYEIIKNYGEERWAKRVAQFIVNERQSKRLATTFDLVETIKKAIPKGARKDGPHPAKRTFQAIRIEVNKELEILEKTFIAAAERLDSDGRIAIITFHSLEDRIAKKTLAHLAQNCICPPSLPICMCNHKAILKNIKSIKAEAKEIDENPRARSARLRAATKI